MIVYIASKLENAERVRALRDDLLRTGHVLTYDWTVHGSVQTGGPAAIARAAAAECEGVRDADVVIVLLPGGKGTHVELGIAHALRKTILIVGDRRAFPGDGRECAFYHGDNIAHLGGEHTAVIPALLSMNAVQLRASIDRYAADCGLAADVKAHMERCSDDARLVRVATARLNATGDAHVAGPWIRDAGRGHRRAWIDGLYQLVAEYAPATTPCLGLGYLVWLRLPGCETALHHVAGQLDAAEAFANRALADCGLSL